MEWIDDNHLKGEMSDAEFQKKVDGEARTRDMSRCGRDGHFSVYEEKLQHLGVSFMIRIVRYFQLGVPIGQTQGMNEIGKWAVIESAPESVELVAAVHDATDNEEFLYLDSLHEHQKDWTLRRQVEDLTRQAFQDIECLPVMLKNYQKESSRIIKVLKKSVKQPRPKSG